MENAMVHLVIRGMLLLFLLLSITTGFKDKSRCIKRKEHEGRIYFEERICDGSNRVKHRRKTYSK